MTFEPFLLRFDTGNAAFDGEDRGAEIARILRLMADRIEARGAVTDGVEWVVRDRNGNEIGGLNLSHRITHPDDEED